MSADIEKVKRNLLIKYPSFGTIIANLGMFEDNNIYSNGIPTIATDGKDIFYHSEYLKRVNDEQLLFDMAHEVSHMAFRHPERQKGKDSEVFNIAADGVVNAFLKRDGLVDYENGVDMPDATKYDVETLYQKLLQEKQSNEEQFANKYKGSSDNKQNSNSGQGSGENGYSDVGHDTHSLWGKAKDKQRQSGNSQNSNNDNTQNKEDKKDRGNDLASQGERKVFNDNKKAREKLLRDFSQSLTAEVRQAGSNTNQQYITLGDIGSSEPLIDWQRLLEEATSIDDDWSYKNCYIEDGIITPQLIEILNPVTEILLDTSGSINDILLRNFLRECKNILSESRLKVGCFDTKFYGFNDIRCEEDIDNMKFIGRGGTDFNVAVNAFSQDAENKIIFTDGYCDMPTKQDNIIWIVFGNEKINPPGGKVIYIVDKQLQELTTSLKKDISGGRTR